MMILGITGGTVAVYRNVAAVYNRIGGPRA
jgi:hypothetical protein